MIPVQTPTGTKFMSLSELLDEDLNLNGVEADGFIDPLTMKAPRALKDNFDEEEILFEFELPSDDEILELEKEAKKKK